MTPGPQSIRDLDLRGQVTSVRGSVVDVSFPAGALPDAGEAIMIEADPARELIAEVQQHLGPTVLRAVALENTAGLRRGALVRPTGAPIRVPVGEAVLGRLLNAIGEVSDRGPPLPSGTERRPIHAAAPPLDRLGATFEVFHTGIKVIDLLGAARQRRQGGHVRGGGRWQDRADHGVDPAPRLSGTRGFRFSRGLASARARGMSFCLS